MTKTCIPCADYRIDDIDAPEFVLQPVLLEKFVVHFGSWGFHLVTERHCSKGSCRRYFPSPRNRRLLEDGQAPFLYSLIPINSRPHKSTAVLFDPTYNTSILGAVIGTTRLRVLAGAKVGFLVLRCGFTGTLNLTSPFRLAFG